MDFTLYWFMFPVAIGVATCAMLSGIGGAALFTPIFVLVFPLLGPEYPLTSTLAAIGAALLTQTFGFLSGLLGYWRRRLIRFDVAWRFARVAVPAGVFGAFLAPLVRDGFLIAGYAVLVFILAIYLLFSQPDRVPEPPDTPDRPGAIDATGVESDPLQPREIAVTGIGAFLTGMVSVGIGEVTVSQLTRRGMPIGFAAGTSVVVVLTTIALASGTLVVRMIRDSGFDAVPWHLVCYTIPGVLIGGQVGPWLQGRVSQRTMERAIALLFLVLCVAMMAVSARKLGPGT